MNVAQTKQFDSPNPEDCVSVPMLMIALLVPVLATMGLAAWPTPGQAVGVVFAPGMSQREAISRIAKADGRIIDFGGMSNVVIAIGPADTFFPDLFSVGAVMILDGQLTGALCVTSRN